MSAKDDLAFVETARKAWRDCHHGIGHFFCDEESMDTVLDLAERGARFTPEHEAELKAWRVADDEGRDTHKGVGDWDSWVDHARRLRALNEASEKENER